MFLKYLLMTSIVAFLIVVLLAPIIIPFLHRLRFGQSIRQEGPQSHMKKAGTPTMGGLIILFSITATTLIFLISSSSSVLYLLLFVLLGYGFIGFFDDFIKIYKQRNLGLTVKQKLFAQFLIGLIFYLGLLQMGHSTLVYIPGTPWGVELGWMYFPFVLLIMVGSSNAVNLTDGLDGLLAGTAAIAFGSFALLSWLYGEISIAVFCCAIVGAVLGFLVFNAHPARVFMGDTGSLALGGTIAAVAILSKLELLLIFIGGVFVLETLSVILQVLSFKWRGKRIFRMSPIHHHFELSGWSEWKVVTFFWFVGLCFAGFGIYIEVFYS